jgi:two-component sensor histidine kinase
MSAAAAATPAGPSSPNGRVSVSWDPHPGYGLSLIRDLIPHDLGGTLDLTFPSDGMCCKIAIPLGRR